MLAATSFASSCDARACVCLCGGQQTPTAGWGAWVCWPASWESAGVYGSGLIDLSLDERDGQAVLCVRMRTECQRTQFHVRREPRALGSASLRLCLLLCGDRDLAALYKIHTISILSIWYNNFAENSRAVPIHIAPPLNVHYETRTPVCSSYLHLVDSHTGRQHTHTHTCPCSHGTRTPATKAVATE